MKENKLRTGNTRFGPELSELNDEGGTMSEYIIATAKDIDEEIAKFREEERRVLQESGLESSQVAGFGQVSFLRNCLETTRREMHQRPDLLLAEYLRKDSDGTACMGLSLPAIIFTTAPRWRDMTPDRCERCAQVKRCRNRPRPS